MSWFGPGGQTNTHQPQPVNSWLGGMDARGQAAAHAFSLSFTRELERELRSHSLAQRVAVPLVGLFTTAIGIAAGGTLAAQRRGRNILDLSMASGMSLGQSSVAYSNLQAFGINPSDVSGIGRNSWMQGMASAGWGVSGSPGSADYLRSYSNRYQSLASQGPMGLMMAQSMESSLGMEGARFMANLSPEQRERQLRRSSAMELAFGMKPDDVRRAAQEMTLFNASLSQFVDLGLAKVGTTVLPRLTTGLDNAIGWIEQNGDRIADGLVRGVETGMNALHSVGRWLYADLPNLALSGLEIANSLVGEVTSLTSSGIESIKEPWTGLFNTIGRGVTDVTNLVGDTIASVMNSDAVRQALALAKTAKPLLEVRQSVANLGEQAAKSVGFGDDAAGAIGFMTPLALGWMGSKWLGGKVAGWFGGGAASGAAGSGAAPGGGFWSGVGRFLTTPLGGTGNGVWVNPWNAVTRGGLTTAARVPAVGIVGGLLGVAGYEGLRELSYRTGLGEWKDLPSTRDIASYYFQSSVLGKPDEQIRQERQRANQNVAAAIAGARPGLSHDGTNYSWTPYTWSDRSASNIFGSMQNGLKSVTDWSDRGKATLSQWRESLGSVEQRRKDYDAFFALAEIAKNTRRTADNSDKQTRSMDKLAVELGYNLIGRIDSYIAQEAANLITRGGVGV
jgi:hypothetical protein